jgi:hypothetical protein
MSAEPKGGAMFAEESGPDEAEEQGDEDTGETDDDLRTLGDAALAAFHTGDGLAFAKAIRDLSGDREE